MRRHTRSIAACALIVLTAAASGCSSQSADVTRDELIDVVESDGVVFAGDGIPGEVLDRLASNRVVAFGETHHLRDHWEFVADVLEELHDDGFRQLLVELPQMVDWILDDWVVSGEADTGWTPPNHIERKFARIREFNLTLAPEERIHVRSIDVNEEYYGGAADFFGLLGLTKDQLPDPGPIDEHLPGNYPTIDPADQTEAMEALLAALETDRVALVASWGSDWYDIVVEMAEVELESTDIRVEREQDDNNAARKREDVIKQLADARIGGYSARTLINFGAHHTQKAHLMGTEQEWLGDYLANRSTVIDGTVFVVSFTSAKTELESGASGTPFDVLEASPANDVLRVMAETWPGQTVFLALDDPMFTDRTVAISSEEIVYVARLAEHGDALLQYGVAHRWPLE